MGWKKDYGYGGWIYQDYHKPLAKKLIKTYKLNNNSKILDIGCGKRFPTLRNKKNFKKNKNLWSRHLKICKK